MKASSSVQARPCITLCASQRTGSTMVFDDLRHLTGHPPCDSERLYRRIVAEKTAEPWETVWADVCEYSNTAGFVVNKFMFHYTPQISSFIAGKPVTKAEKFLEFKPELFYDFYQFFRDSIWVYIERRDVFAQAVSMYCAEVTSLWEVYAGAPARTPLLRAEVAYDGVRLRKYLRQFLAERAQWQRFFDHYRIVPLRIAYEDAAARYPAYLDELLARAGVQVRPPVPERRLIKVGTGLNTAYADTLRAEVLAELYAKALAAG